MQWNIHTPGTAYTTGKGKEVNPEEKAKATASKVERQVKEDGCMTQWRLVFICGSCIRSTFRQGQEEGQECKYELDNVECELKFKITGKISQM